MYYSILFLCHISLFFQYTYIYICMYAHISSKRYSDIFSRHLFMRIPFNKKGPVYILCCSRGPHIPHFAAPAWRPCCPTLLPGYEVRSVRWHTLSLEAQVRLSSAGVAALVGVHGQGRGMAAVRRAVQRPSDLALGSGSEPRVLWLPGGVIQRKTLTANC